MEIIFLMLLIFLGVGAYVAYTSRSKGPALKGAKAPKSLDPLADASAGGDRQFWELKPGDLVKRLDGGDFLVRRSVGLNEGGYQWREHLLDDAQGTKRWLSVEDDNGLDLGWWEQIVPGDIETGNAGDKQVQARGQVFKLHENGGATYSNVSPTGEPFFGEMEYFQYETDEGRMLAFQRYEGGKWEASMGDRVKAGDFDIYPSTDTPTGDER